MKRTLIIVLCALALSCAKKEEKGQTRTIGVTLLTRGHIFYKDLEEGLREEADFCAVGEQPGSHHAE